MMIFYLFFWGGGGVGNPKFFLHIFSSWVMVRLHTENQLDSLPGSASTVCVGGSGWWLVVALAQAKQKPYPWKEGQRLLGNKSMV